MLAGYTVASRCKRKLYSIAVCLCNEMASSLAFNQVLGVRLPPGAQERSCVVRHQNPPNPPVV